MVPPPLQKKNLKEYLELGPGKKKEGIEVGAGVLCPFCQLFDAFVNSSRQGFVCPP